MITQEKLHELFDYQDDGNLIWKKTSSSSALRGNIAGVLDRHAGYYRVGIDRKKYLLHRLIFLYHKGYLTQGMEIDHINMEKTNNRIDNLREVTRAQNSYNTRKSATNVTGVKGVAWCKTKKKYKVTVSLNGKNIHLGYFDDLKEAEAAAIAGRKELHGDFARHD
jgi:hypothetical protein